jgi:amidase
LTASKPNITDELQWRDALAQAAAVRRGEVSPLELAEAALARIERLDPPLHCVVTRLVERARAAAREPLGTGTLAGVPMLLKDFLALVGGVRHTGGSRLLAHHVPDHDSELVRRYERAGLVIVGLTNTPELAMVSTTEPVLHGPTRNPWDLGRSPGGSSGGAAAAVAAGLTPVAHGNDSAGSLRIPASCCGVFGLKPTRGRNTLAPDFDDLAAGLWAEHVITRSVRDSAAVLDATAGPAPGEPCPVGAPERPFLAQADRPPRRLRVGFSARPPRGGEAHPDCVRAVRETAELCADLGHEVGEAAPEVDGASLEGEFFALYAEATAARVARWEEWLGREAGPGELEPLSQAVREVGRRRTAVEHLLTLGRVARLLRGFGAFFEEHDVWLTPTLAEPPPPLGWFDPAPDDPLAVLERDARFSPFTWPANLTGQPAMSVPLLWNGDGLPVGSHFMARWGEEGTLLALASQLEEARPWAQRRPPAP